MVLALVLPLLLLPQLFGLLLLLELGRLGGLSTGGGAVACLLQAILLPFSWSSCSRSLALRLAFTMSMALDESFVSCFSSALSLASFDLMRAPLPFSSISFSFNSLFFLSTFSLNKRGNVFNSGISKAHKKHDQICSLNVPLFPVCEKVKEKKHLFHYLIRNFLEIKLSS